MKGFSLVLYRCGHPEREDTRYFVTVDKVYNEDYRTAGNFHFVHQFDDLSRRQVLGVNKIVIKYSGQQSGLIAKMSEYFDEE